MGYAVKNDGTGWRAVDSQADVDTAMETYSATQPAPVQPSAQQQLQVQAQAELVGTDLVASRCFKAGVAFPAAWQTYTQALRAIVNGADTTSTNLPTKPAYPAGT
jgi:hypothetical protein